MLTQLKSAIESASPAAGVPIKLVAIDGHGGAGKSQLARTLAKELRAEILQTDDFASMQNPLDWWPDLIKKVLEPIKSGAKTLSYNRSSWWENHHPEPVVDQPITPIMILEGVSASRREFRPYLAYSIWVETPREIYQARGIARDLASNPDNQDPEEIKQIWETWHKYETDYVERDHPQEYANVIVDGTKPYTR